jgi:hypothetical protein
MRSDLSRKGRGNALRACARRILHCHCERSEAIHRAARKNGLLRRLTPRNGDGRLSAWHTLLRQGGIIILFCFLFFGADCGAGIANIAHVDAPKAACGEIKDEGEPRCRNIMEKVLPLDFENNVEGCSASLDTFNAALKRGRRECMPPYSFFWFYRAQPLAAAIGIDPINSGSRSLNDHCGYRDPFNDADALTGIPNAPMDMVFFHIIVWGRANQIPE